VIWLVPVAAVLVVVLLAVALLYVRSVPPSGASGAAVAYINSSKGLMAVRASDGHILWKSSLGSFSMQPPSDQGAVFLLGDGGHGSYPLALRASDGAPLWRAETLAGDNPNLTAAAGVLYFTANFPPSGQSNTEKLQPAILALRESDGHLLWRYDAPAPIVSVPVVDDGMVFVEVGATLVALQGSDGALRWQVSLPRTQPTWAEHLVAGNGALYVYIQDVFLNGNLETGVAPVRVFAFRATDGSPTWQVNLGNEFAFTGNISTPVLVNGVLYSLMEQLGDQPQTILLALSARDGSRLWSDTTPQQRRMLPFISGPFFSNGALYFSDVANFVEAVRASDGKILWKQPFDFSTSVVWLATQETIPVQVDNNLLGLRASDGARLWQINNLY
jgi:outer membrane protein assembly factor BamB